MNGWHWIGLAGLVAALGCSGIVGQLENNPEFRQSFNEGFREEFVKSCSDSAGGGADAEEICACTADKLLADHTPSELVALDENVAVAAAEACMK